MCPSITDPSDSDMILSVGSAFDGDITDEVSLVTLVPPPIALLMLSNRMPMW